MQDLDIRGGNLNIINHGTVPDFVQQEVAQIKNALSNKNSQMATFLVHRQEGVIIHIWVALSGFGNQDKTNNKIEKLSHLPFCSFVPFRPFNNPEIYQPDAQPNSPRVKRCAGDIESYDDRKMLFIRFLLDVKKGCKNKGNNKFDRVIKEKFSLTPDLIKSINIISSLPHNAEQVHEEYLKAMPSGTTTNDFPRMNFFVKVAFQCYKDDEMREAGKKATLLSALVILDPKTRNPICDAVYRTCQSYIEALGLKKFDKYYIAFEALWKHTMRFSTRILGDMLNHCAETNLMTYLKENNILSRMGQFHLFSTEKNNLDEQAALRPMCELCSKHELPSLVMFNEHAGHPSTRMMIATMPIEVIQTPGDCETSQAVLAPFPHAHTIPDEGAQPCTLS